MNDLKTLRSEELISKTKALVQKERDTTLAVIEHLQEIYSRRLHLQQGYSSLHEFLVKELSYSDGAAHRRISAMRLVQDIPEVRASIADGKLSLTTASQVQGFFQSEKKNRRKSYALHEKLKLISRVEGTSRQECERRLSQVSPAYCEKPRVISLPEDQELVALLEEYRLLAMLSNGSPQNVLKSALRAAIGEIKARHARSVERKRASLAKRTDVPRSAPAESLSKLEASPAEPQPSRYIPKHIKRAVWSRGQGRCVYRNPKTKRRCEARHHLEIDHLHPFAMDGQTTADNLQLLCRAHNQLRAFEIYGSHAAGR